MVDGIHVASSASVLHQGGGVVVLNVSSFDEIWHLNWHTDHSPNSLCRWRASETEAGPQANAHVSTK